MSLFLGLVSGFLLFKEKSDLSFINWALAFFFD